MPLDGKIENFVQTKPLSDIGEICHRAAEIIERRGLHCREGCVIFGPVCMMQAVSIAAGVPFLGKRGREYLNYRALNVWARALGFGGTLRAALWSDRRGRRADGAAEVIALLRAVS